MKNTHQNKQKNIHEPVLLDAVLQYLNARPGNSYLDTTAGYGGHAKAILARTLKPSLAALVDRDNAAIEELTRQFGAQGVQIIQKDYLSASEELLKDGRKFDMILADLGVSSLHLNEASRGFSIKSDGPLDMRMDQKQALSAAEIVNNYQESELADIIKKYGEDPKAKQIARLIIKSRPILSTAELASVVKKVWPGQSRVHPATRTFQAIRIAVNDELNQLQKALPIWVDLLEPGGRLGVISFHSLEDRIVKVFFSEKAGDRYDAELKILNKHPVMAGQAELVNNPRARSAKLRTVAKIKTKERR